MRPFETETVPIAARLFRVIGAGMGLVQSRRWKILLVEDDAELRLLTKTVLEESELDILECESGEAPLATMLLQGQNV